MEKEFFSTAEIAEMLGISRIAVHKKIKSGEIRAEKIGRNFFIRKDDLPETGFGLLTEGNKEAINKAVKKTVRDYKETLQLLGKE